MINNQFSQQRTRLLDIRAKRNFSAHFYTQFLCTIFLRCGFVFIAHLFGTFFVYISWHFVCARPHLNIGSANRRMVKTHLSSVNIIIRFVVKLFMDQPNVRVASHKTHFEFICSNMWNKRSLRSLSFKRFNPRLKKEIYSLRPSNEKRKNENKCSLSI